MRNNVYQWHILLWIPNLIGYLRILVCMLGTLRHLEGHYTSCILLFVLNFILDGLDGYLARQLNQSSIFGAWLCQSVSTWPVVGDHPLTDTFARFQFDVFVDLIARGFLWIIVHTTAGYCIITWEWLAFFAIHSIFGQTWKEAPKAPPLVSSIMRNNFKTIHGFYVVGSLFLLPVWCYIMLYLGHMLPVQMSYGIQLTILVSLSIGRLLAAIAEGWYIWQFIKSLLAVRQDKPS